MRTRSGMIRTASFTLFLLTATLIGCKKDNPAEPDDQNNPQELITTVILSLVDTSGTGPATVAAFRDIDGPGGNSPTIDTLKLTAGKIYNGTIVLLNEARTPVDTISNEVENEKNSHQFFYTPQGGISSRVTVTKLDLDTNNPPLPVGLRYRVAVTSGGPAAGSLRVILSHYDRVPKTVNPSAETDVDVVFPLTIQ